MKTIYLYHFSDMLFLFLILFVLGFIAHDAGRVKNRRRILGATVRHGYRWHFVLIRYRIVTYVPSPSAEGRFASTGTAGAIRRLAAVTARSYVRLEHQEIWFGYFEGVKASLEAVAVTKAIQSRKHVVVHWTAAEISVGVTRVRNFLEGDLIY